MRRRCSRPRQADSSAAHTAGHGWIDAPRRRAAAGPRKPGPWLRDARRLSLRPGEGQVVIPRGMISHAGRSGQAGGGPRLEPQAGRLAQSALEVGLVEPRLGRQGLRWRRCAAATDAAPRRRAPAGTAAAPSEPAPAGPPAPAAAGRATGRSWCRSPPSRPPRRPSSVRRGRRVPGRYASHPARRKRNPRTDAPGLRQRRLARGIPGALQVAAAHRRQRLGRHVHEVGHRTVRRRRRLARRGGAHACSIGARMDPAGAAPAPARGDADERRVQPWHGTRQPDRNRSRAPHPRRHGCARPTLMEACLARIAEREPAVRAFAYVRSRRRAAPPRAAPPGPLHGLPIGVKDVLDTADMPSEYGSPIWRGWRPRADAAAVAWARAAGARGDRQDRHHRVRHPQARPDDQPGTIPRTRRAGRAAARRPAWRRASSRWPTARRPPAA